MNSIQFVAFEFFHICCCFVSFAIANYFLYSLTFLSTFVTKFDSNKISLYQLHSLVFRIAPYSAKMLCIICFEDFTIYNICTHRIILKLMRRTGNCAYFYIISKVNSFETLHKFVAYIHHK